MPPGAPQPPYGWLDRCALEHAAQQRAAQLRQQLADPSLAAAATAPSLRRSQLELLGERHWPSRHHGLLPAQDPGPEVALLTVANDRFYRGLEAMLLSLRAVYPQFSAPLVVVHDGSLGPFLQRRLAQIHPLVRFAQPQPAWAEALPLDSHNRRRIGVIGYLNSEALALRDYRRVLVLDSDLLITGALDPLWAPGEAFRAVPDCGDRPWAAVSPRTGRPVLNSGVLSLPGWALHADLQRRMEALIRAAREPVCPLLDRFADQKVWNLLLADQPLELLPLNFNCNVKYLVQYLGGCAEGLSVVHFAGPKPWLSWPWLAPEPVEQRPGAVVDPLFWNRCYRSQLMAWRLELQRQALAAAPPLPPGPAQLALDPRQLQPEPGVSRHLLLVDPGRLAGRWPDACAWPAGWLEALSQAAPLKLWAPLEWEPALRSLPLPPEVQWRWRLIEAPFSPALDDGDDLLAEPAAGPGLEPGAFEPWSEPLLPALERAVRRALLRAGAEPLPGLAGEAP
jgi:hypothetical protein